MNKIKNNPTKINYNKAKLGNYCPKEIGMCWAYHPKKKHKQNQDLF